jgi:hypothetical protein
MRDMRTCHGRRVPSIMMNGDLYLYSNYEDNYEYNNERTTRSIDLGKFYFPRLNLLLRDSLVKEFSDALLRKRLTGLFSWGSPA